MSIPDEFRDLGRVWLRAAVPDQALKKLASFCSVQHRPGQRLALTDEIAALVEVSSELCSALSILGNGLSPVRLVAFNKSSGANWAVPWHQDRIIAVAQRHDVPGYKNWVAKSGFWHCEPPEAILQQMIFVRIHFDENSIDNGALELALRTHKRGPVSADQAGEIAASAEVEICYAEPGDILIAHALLLHRSRSAIVPGSRRVLRVDYAQQDSFNPLLEWAVAQSVDMPTG